MRMDEFHNALRILTSLDQDEVVAGGVTQLADAKAYDAFRQKPHHWFIQADDDAKRALWALIERRQRPMFKVTEAHRIDGEAAP